MNPVLNVDKPKIAEVERIRCSCCIRQVFYRLKHNTSEFIRGITPFYNINFINYIFVFDKVIYK